MLITPLVAIGGSPGGGLASKGGIVLGSGGGRSVRSGRSNVHEERQVAGVLYELDRFVLHQVWKVVGCVVCPVVLSLAIIGNIIVVVDAIANESKPLGPSQRNVFWPHTARRQSIHIQVFSEESCPVAIG